MRFSLLRSGRAAAAVTGLAVTGLAAAAVAASLPAAASVPAARTTVVVNCRGAAQVRPGRYVLTCADGNNFLTGLRWASWPASGSAAFGRGIERINTCVPDCAHGRLRSYPVLITLWRAQSRPHHAAQRAFTRATVVYTGARPVRYGSGGTKTHPVTATFHI